MKLYTLSLLMLLTVGCNGVNRLLGQEGHRDMPNQNNINPDDYYVVGTTIKDYQSVYLNIIGRTISVEVMLPNELNWKTLERSDPPFNSYQLFTIPNQGVHFGDRAEKDSNGTLHVYSGYPAAPIGTQYRIHSVAK